MTDGSFSPAQLQAINAPDGPVALVAGPGCGKTTTLAARIAFLINDRGVDPASTLVVSFTIEAARRLRREVARLLGDRAGDVAILTLHALGRRVIDTWSVRLGYEDRPSVLGYDEARALLASTAESLGWDLAAVPIGEVTNAVDRCRLLPDQHAREADPLAPLAAAYEERLRRYGAIDFVAMLSLPLRLFDEHEQALRVLQDAYQYVMADESQDLDPSQWRLVELLGAQHGNLLVAGDDAQCLFQWRGADHHAMRRFVERHPDSTMITLDKNHRSTSRLVEVSNALAELMVDYTPLWTDNPSGPLPRVLLAEDEQAEASFVADRIAGLLEQGLLSGPGDAAVVFRTRAQADVFAAALRSAGLPYNLGHADLFGTRVVRDVLAYLRLAVNPGDRTALARIVDTPRRGLGLVAATLLEDPAATSELVARAADFGPGAMSAAAALVATIYELNAEAIHGATAATLLDRALDRSGYRGWLERHPDGTRRLRLLGRLRQIALRAEVSVAEWLAGAAIGEDLLPGDEDAVRLSSVHLAKGREWRATFVAGVEEGLFPHRRAIVAASADAAGTEPLDEELRGLYVAVTRARERLYLTACLRRSGGERSEPRQPSRWLEALPPGLLASA
jgi:DNA helicase-2/ATP-dependent DNA helicase PcrA